MRRPSTRLLATAILAAALGGLVVPTGASALSWSAPRAIARRAPFAARIAPRFGLTCPSTHLCLSVAGTSVATSTNPIAGARSWTVSRIDHEATPESGGDPLGLLACPSARLCVGSDTGGNIVTSTDPGGGSTAWTRYHMAGVGPEGVTCPSPSLCVAVVNDLRSSAISASTNPTAGPDSWKTTTLNVGGLLGSLVCPSTRLCIVFDSNGKVLSSTNPGAYSPTWKMTGRGLRHIPGPVACPSAHLCVGVYGHGSLERSTDPTRGGGAWRRVEPGLVQALSCPSVHLCVGVAFAGRVLSSTNPSGGRSSWHWIRIHQGSRTNDFQNISCPSIRFCIGADDGGVFSSRHPTKGVRGWSSVSTAGTSPLYGISCSPDGTCVAVGNTAVASTRAVAGGGGAWKILHGGLFATNISCPSANACFGGDPLGDIVSSTHPTGPASSWKTTRIVPPVDAGEGGGQIPVPITAISCPTASFCLAGDGDGDLIPSTVWSDLHRAPTALVDGAVTGIACPTAGFCAATGSQGEIRTSTDPTDSSSWSTATTDPGQALTGISCPTAGLCVAVDDAGTVLSSTSPSTSAWTTNAIDPAHDLTGVSCGTPRLCVAIDDAGHALEATNPTSAWTSTPIELHAGLPGGNAFDGLPVRLTGISCASALLCVATDDYGDVIAGMG